MISASASWRSARRGSNTGTSGRRCRPPTVPTTGNASMSPSTRAVRNPEGQGTDGCGDPQFSTSRKVNIVQPVHDIDVVDLPQVDGQQRRHRRTVGRVRRVRARCTGARAGQLLPELDGSRGGGAVPHRSQPDGRRPHRHARAPVVRTIADGPVLLRADAPRDRPGDLRPLPRRLELPAARHDHGGAPPPPSPRPAGSTADRRRRRWSRRCHRWGRRPPGAATAGRRRVRRCRRCPPAERRGANG